MNIELATSSPTLLKITWPYYDDASIEPEILRRLAQVPGAEGQPRRYYCPAIQCERLMQLFSRASFDYAALQAADKAARDFYESMRTTGIELAIEGDKVRATGDNVSPLVAQLVEERSPALMSFVQLEMDRASRKPQTPEPVTVGDPDLEPLAKGILNAQKKAEELQRYQYGKRKTKAKPVQGAFDL